MGSVFHTKRKLGTVILGDGFIVILTVGDSISESTGGDQRECVRAKSEKFEGSRTGWRGLC